MLKRYFFGNYWYEFEISHILSIIYSHNEFKELTSFKAKNTSNLKIWTFIKFWTFSNLFSDWSIQNSWEIVPQKFWIDQSEKREGKFKIQKWSNFGPNLVQTGTRYLETEFSFVICVVRRSFGLRDSKIWDGVKGPNKLMLKHTLLYLNEKIL